MAPQFSEGKTYYTTVAGTHSWDEDPNHYEWWEKGSALTEYLRGFNLELHPFSPFEWSTDLDGVLFRKNLRVWKAAARHFICHCDRMSHIDRNVIAHSHGGNVVLIAAALGLRIRHLITVGTPVRSDMDSYVMAAAGNIDYWFHISDSKTDIVAILGTLFDGRIRVKHTFDLADDGDDIKGIGHSKILNEQPQMEFWGTRGWAHVLRFGKRPSR